MKLNSQALFINAGILIVFGLCGLISAGSAGLGLAFVTIALLDVVLVVYYSIRKNRQAMQTCLLCAGISLLAGFSFCSSAFFH
jgi:hypothetical protein